MDSIAKRINKNFVYHITLSLMLSSMMIATFVYKEDFYVCLLLVEFVFLNLILLYSNNYFVDLFILNFMYFIATKIIFVFALLSGSLESTSLQNIFSNQNIITVLLATDMLALISFIIFSLLTQLNLLKNTRRFKVKKSYQYFKIISLFNTSMLLVSHSVAYLIINLKFFAFGVAALGASGILFPITFANSDIITEQYGSDHNNLIIWMMLIGQLSYLVTLLLLKSATNNANIHIIAAHFFRQIFAATPSILSAFWVGGSIITFFRIHKLRFIWRVIISTVFAKAAMSLITYGILFFHVYSVDKTLEITFNMWIFKTIFGIMLLPYIIGSAKIFNTFRKSVHHRKDSYNLLDFRVYTIDDLR